MSENPTSRSGGNCCGGNSINTEAGDSCKIIDKSPNRKIALWVTGTVHTPFGEIPQVATQLTLNDKVGSWKARWSLGGRMNFKIIPGIYAVGTPNEESPVLVTANYKMSFDRLRKELGGINAWILVLDTKGINVWCAAGKGTFGTNELVNRITQVGLAEIVTHRILILPQLGAPGVAAHEVAKQTGFKVIYGPVRAEDVPAFLDAGMKATPAMREVRFGFLDRFVLTPIELVGTYKAMLISLAVLFVIQWLSHSNMRFIKLIQETWSSFVPYFGAIIAGAIFVPVLLPFIPGRSLAWKGWLMGLVWAGLYLGVIHPGASWKQVLLYLLLLPPISSFLGMNFTGATTYTSLSGVVKEMKIAIPAQILFAGVGIIVLIGTWILPK